MCLKHVFIIFIHRRREHPVLVSAITKHTPSVCAVGVQRTTSRKNDVLPVDIQLPGPGNVSIKSILIVPKLWRAQFVSMAVRGLSANITVLFSFIVEVNLLFLSEGAIFFSFETFFSATSFLTEKCLRDDLKFYSASIHFHGSALPA